jgi:hypothetical protein
LKFIMTVAFTVQKSPLLILLDLWSDLRRSNSSPATVSGNMVQRHPRRVQHGAARPSARRGRATGLIQVKQPATCTRLRMTLADKPV